jgi:hypothetical protein
VIKLLNKHHYDDDFDGCVSIMRPNVLGNPYSLHGYRGPLLDARGMPVNVRGIVIEQFREHLWVDFAARGPMLAEVCRLARMHLAGRDVLLLCCCVPLRCHGEVVVKAIEWVADEMKAGRIR